MKAYFYYKYQMYVKWGNNKDIVSNYLEPILSVYHFSFFLKKIGIYSVFQMFLYIFGSIQIILTIYSWIFMVQRLKRIRSLKIFFHNDIVTIMNIFLFSVFADIFLIEFNCNSTTNTLNDFREISCTFSTVRTFQIIFSSLSIISLFWNCFYPLLNSSNRDLSKFTFSLRRNMYPEFLYLLLFTSNILTIQKIVILQQNWVSLSVSLIISYFICQQYSNQISVTYFRAVNYYLYGSVMTVWTNICFSLDSFTGGSVESPLIYLALGYFLITLVIILKPDYIDQKIIFGKSGSKTSLKEWLIKIETLILLNKLSSNANLQLIYAYAHNFDVYSTKQGSNLTLSAILNEVGVIEPKKIFNILEERISQHISQQFLIGLKIFPDVVELRVVYSHFLYYFIHNIPLALEVLRSARNIPDLGDYDNFLIYQMEQSINSSIQEYGANLGDSKQNTEVKKVKLETQKNVMCRILDSQLLKAVRCFSNFWGTLHVENPDLKRVYNCLESLNTQYLKVTKLWRQNKKIFMKVPKILENYGLFSYYLVNEKEAGMEMIILSKDLLDLEIKQTYELTNMKRGVNLSNSSTPYAILTQENGLIRITDLNSSFSSLLSHKKNSLRNKRLIFIIPKQTRRLIIDKIMKRLEKGSTAPLEVCLLLKGNFLKEFAISVFYLPQLSSMKKKDIKLQLSPKSQVNPACTFLLSRDGAVYQTSSSLAYIFPNYSRIDGEQIFIQKVLHKDEKILNLVESFFKSDKKEVLGTLKEKFQEYDLSYRMKRLSQKENELFLFSVQIERISTTIESLDNKQTYRSRARQQTPRMIVTEQLPRVEQFYFEFDPNYEIIVGQYGNAAGKFNLRNFGHLFFKKGQRSIQKEGDDMSDNGNSDNPAVAMLNTAANVKLGAIKLKKSVSRLDDGSKRSINLINKPIYTTSQNYAENIQTLRVNQGRLFEIFQGDEEEELDEERKAIRIENEQIHKNKAQDKKMNIFSRKQNVESNQEVIDLAVQKISDKAHLNKLVLKMGQSRYSITLAVLNIIFILFYILTESLISYFNISLVNRIKAQNDSENNLSDIDGSLLEISSNISDILLLQQGYETFWIDKLEFFELKKKSIKELQDFLQKANLVLYENLEAGGFYDYSSKLQDYNNINVKYEGGTIKQNNIRETLKQLEAIILSIVNLDISNFKETQKDLYFVKMNVISKLHYEINNIAFKIHFDFHEYGVIQYEYIILRAITANFCGLIFLLLFIYLVIAYISHFDNLFKYYYGFDQATCREMLEICEFVNAKISTGESDEGSDSGLDMDYFNFIDQSKYKNNDQSDEIVLKATRKKPDNVNKYINKLKVIIFIALILNAAVINISNFIYYTVLKNTNAPLAFKSIIVRNTHFFRISEAILKATVYNQNDQFWDKGRNIDVGVDYLTVNEGEYIEVVYNSLLYLPKSNNPLLEKFYYDNFSGSICDHIQSQNIAVFEATNRPCENLSHGILTKGFNYLVSQHMDTVMEYFQRIQSILDNPDAEPFYYGNIHSSVGISDSKEDKIQKRIRTLAKEGNFRDLCNFWKINFRGDSRFDPTIYQLLPHRQMLQSSDRRAQFNNFSLHDSTSGRHRFSCYFDGDWGKLFFKAASHKGTHTGSNLFSLGTQVALLLIFLQISS